MDEAPGYEDMIARPMDLATVRVRTNKPHRS